MENVTRKRCIHSSTDSEEGHERKRVARGDENDPDISGAIVVDTENRRWKLGAYISEGGFGKVYLASEDVTGTVTIDGSKYVSKIEPYENPTLAFEINILTKIGERKSSENSTENAKNSCISLPKIVGHGSHVFDRKQYRFLMLPRYTQSLAPLIRKKTFDDKAISILAVHLIHAIEDLHYFKCCHNDIKAENIMITTHKVPIKAESKKTTDRELRSSKRKTQQLTSEGSEMQILKLIDLGVANLFQEGKVHHRFNGPRGVRHKGTLPFIARDGHLGAYSRRGDLESLGYNLLFWSQGYLPWNVPSINYDLRKVHHSKELFMSDVKRMMKVIYGNNVPKFLVQFLFHVKKLTFEQTPNYNSLRNIFKKEYQKLGGDPQVMEINTSNIQRTATPIVNAQPILKVDILNLRKQILAHRVEVSPTLMTIFRQNPLTIVSKRVADERKSASKARVVRRANSKLLAQKRLQARGKPSRAPQNKKKA